MFVVNEMMNEYDRHRKSNRQCDLVPGLELSLSIFVSCVILGERGETLDCVVCKSDEVSMVVSSSLSVNCLEIQSHS